jgi:tetratricopeptide (TPR) repeat protein
MGKIIPAWIIALVLIAVSFSGDSSARSEGFFYSGQVASFRSHQDAAEAVKALAARGQKAFYEKSQVKGKGVYFRVYVGYYASRDEARKELGRLKADKVIGDFLIQKKEGVPPQKQKEKVTAKAVMAPAEKPAPVEAKQEKPAETDADYSNGRGGRNAEYYYILGAVFDAKGKHESALKNYTRALEKDPKYAPAYNKRGVIYLLMGHSDLAIADHGRAIGIDPSNVEYRFNRGLDYRLAGRQDQAMADFAAACRMGLDQACDALRRLEEKMEKDKAGTDAGK